MDEDRAREVLRELERRHKRIRNVQDESFPEQDRFVRDASQFVAACCTRRAGKSNGLALKYFRTAQKFSGVILPYVSLTRDSAKNIMWPALNEMNERFKLGGVPTESNLTFRMPRDVIIKLFGADQKGFIRKLKGIKTPLAGIDEAQDFGSHLESLVDDVLTPATADFEDRGAQIVLTGTPGPIPKGYFYDVTEGKKFGYSLHKWSLYQNPYMPDPRGFVARLKEKKGWSDENPTLLREYMGKWVLDLDALVYKYRPEHNDYTELPGGHDYSRVLVIDYGWNDQTAFGITTFSRTLKRGFQEHAEGHSQWIPSQMAKRINELREKYKPYKIMADTGGLGKTITEELRQRYHIPVEPVVKTDKLAWISLLNGDFIDRIFSLNSKLTDLKVQMNTLRKADDGLEVPGMPNDLCDVTLYGYREIKHYLSVPKEPEPAHGSEAWGNREAKRMEQRELERFEEEQREERERKSWENY